MQSEFCEDCCDLIKRLDHEAMFAFAGPIQTAIQQAKFLPSEIKARRLMRNLPPFEKGGQGGISARDAITFVPIHWRRRIKRGFDLSAIFALTLGKKLKLPVLDLLENTRFDTPLTLAKSREERFKLTQGRYVIRKHVSPRRMLLVDDVTTTGATLETARKVLSDAGHNVQVYALAKTLSF
jgi:predicted amidophosphoribosyltransferase